MASQELSSKGKDLVVFWLVNESACSECGEDLGRGQFLRLENDRPLCMACADLEHLLFLPRGDAALTRRAGKHSRLRAVVVRFSRTRKRYERQGILVDEDALTRAEEECLADAEARALARERASEQRARLDLQYVTAFGERVRELFPGCPSAESGKIAQHACLLRSGRIDRAFCRSD